jgi:hypothetical protein
VGGIAQIVGPAAAKTVVLHSGGRRVVVLTAPPPPYRVDVDVTPTFSPADYGLADTRQLGAQVSIRAGGGPA